MLCCTGEFGNELTYYIHSWLVGPCFADVVFSREQNIETDTMLSITEVHPRFFCNYCQEEINGLRVSCAYCTDFDLCPECFACGAEIGGHKNHHKYFFSNNGNFSIFPKSPSAERRSARRASLQVRHKQNSKLRKTLKEIETSKTPCVGGGGAAREPGGDQLEREGGHQAARCRGDVWLWQLEGVRPPPTPPPPPSPPLYPHSTTTPQDIAKHVETKGEGQVKERYTKCYIVGSVGRQTWSEDARAVAVDHTQHPDTGPLSPTFTSKLPPINVAPSEALMLGYMPNRDDFEDFDR